MSGEMILGDSKPPDAGRQPTIANSRLMPVIEAKFADSPKRNFSSTADTQWSPRLEHENWT